MHSLRLFTVLVLAAQSLHAELPPNGSPIRTSDYRIDLHQGPVVGSTRVLSLGGAYVAIAEGVDGLAQNPASPAVRTRWSFDDFDYDLGAGITFPSMLKATDFFNAGSETRRGAETGFLFLEIAANLQWLEWGVGGSFELQTYNLLRSTAAGERQDRLSAQIGLGHWVLARSFFDGQLALGGGARTTGMSVINSNALPGESGDLISTLGVGFEAGAVFRPEAWPCRLGAAVRSALTPLAATPESDRVLYEGTGDELFLPDEVMLPWEVSVGAAVQIGPRILNPRFTAPKRDLAFLDKRLADAARARLRRTPTQAGTAGTRTRATERAYAAELESHAALDEAVYDLAYGRLVAERRRAYLRENRFYVLLSASLVVTGRSQNAVGVEAFLHRTVDRSGESVTVSPRVGVESEVIPDWLRLAVGGYYEPTRFRSNLEGGRLHATTGLSVKLFPWTVFGLFDDGTAWRIGGAIDSARQYLGWGLTAGVWR